MVRVHSCFSTDDDWLLGGALVVPADDGFLPQKARLSVAAEASRKTLILFPFLGYGPLLIAYEKL